jgi:hypothetical protein
MTNLQKLVEQELELLDTFVTDDTTDHLNLSSVNFKQVSDLLESYKFNQIDRSINSSDIFWSFKNETLQIDAERCLYTDEWNFYKDFI